MDYRCPHCHAMLSENEVMGGICPGCRKVIDVSSADETENPLRGPGEKEASADQDQDIAEGNAGVKRSVVVGIVTGILVLLFYTILDVLFFKKAPFGGWVGIVLGIVLTGSLMGAVVGLVVEKTRNRGCGILSGAGLLALIYLFIPTGRSLRPGFNLAALLPGAFYGAIFGWAITSAIIEHIRREE